jgi:HD superfamily phosphodiesterase
MVSREADSSRQKTIKCAESRIKYLDSKGVRSMLKENKISTIKAKNLENKWSKKTEEEIHYISNMYKTNNFSTYNQINRAILYYPRYKLRGFM